MEADLKESLFHKMRAFEENFETWIENQSYELDAQYQEHTKKIAESQGTSCIHATLHDKALVYLLIPLSPTSLTPPFLLTSTSPSLSFRQSAKFVSRMRNARWKSLFVLSSFNPMSRQRRMYGLNLT